MIRLLCVLTFFLFQSIDNGNALASEEEHKSSWNLPFSLSDNNAKVSFKLDSTWHVVHGTAEEITGHVGLPNPDAPQFIEIRVSIPVAKLDTENSMRDKKMRRVMSAEMYPNILFEGRIPSLHCSPALVTTEGVCSDTVIGRLSIMNQTKDVSFPIQINKDEAGGFIMNGGLTILWAEYGVEDPSILIAKVDPEVHVEIEVNLPAGL